MTKEREALAQPEQEQEPVAVIGNGFQLLWCREDWSKDLKVGDPLYTTPPQRTWVGLTDEDIAVVLTGDASLGTRLDELTPSWIELVKVVEAKLKEKNT